MIPKRMSGCGTNGASEAISLEQTIVNWQESSNTLRESKDDMKKMLERVDSESNSL